jgi:hypothetical protein
MHGRQYLDAGVVASSLSKQRLEVEHQSLHERRRAQSQQETADSAEQHMLQQPRVSA